MNAPAALTPPPGPLPGPPQPYAAPQIRAIGGMTPVEPWRDSLRLWMFVWGALALVAFATPSSINPLVFGWDKILHGEGKDRLLALIVPAVGLLAIVVGGLPMPAMPRGLIAALLGLAGTVVPWFVESFPPWQAIAFVVGMLTLVPGLLVRGDYRESIVPRVLVTIGVLAVLVTMLVPEHGAIPLVDSVKQLMDAPRELKVTAALDLGLVVVIVMALLAWMPAPATGGAKVFAWLVILWPAFEVIGRWLTSGAIGPTVTNRPATLVEWIASPTGLGAAYTVLVGYGAATVVGKQLE